MIATWLYVEVSLITILYHMHLNVRSAAAIVSPMGDALDFCKGFALTHRLPRKTLRQSALFGNWATSRAS